jgi:hypothetical protein
MEKGWRVRQYKVVHKRSERKDKEQEGGRERKGSEKWKSHRDRVEQINIEVGSVQEMHP